MYNLNDKIRNLVPYEPVSGNFKIRLDANESCFNLPDDMMRKIKEKIASVDFNRYPDPMAAGVCDAFADYYGIDADNVTAGNGSDELISIIMQAFMMKGETLLTIEPDFSMYSFYGALSEVNCCAVKKNDDYTVNIDSVIDAVNAKKARAVIFSNPCNPTSLGVQREDIIRLISSVDSLVILDEAYMDFWEESLLDRVNDFDNLIILRTASKAVGAAAIRLGFAVSNKVNTKAFRAVKSPYNVNTMTQEIGTLIYSDTKYLKNVRKTIVTLRKSLYNDLKALACQYPDKLSMVNGCCNFIYIKSNVSEDVFKYLLSHGVAIRFMGEYLRISTGTQQENSELIQLLKEYFK